MNHVLFIEDEEDLRMIMREALSLSGYEVTVACDGHEALAELEKQTRFSHVVTDVSMPRGISGIEVAARVAQLQPEATVVIVSGYQRSQLPDLPSGSRFLLKPYRIPQLLGMLADSAR
jgi:CheY-like chemotaxis protein